MKEMIKTLLKKQEQGYVWCVINRYNTLDDMPYSLVSCHNTYDLASKARKGSESMAEIADLIADEQYIVEQIKKGDL